MSTRSSHFEFQKKIRLYFESHIWQMRDIILTILLLAPVWGMLIWSMRHYQLDDALIYCRYLRNFYLHGQLVYNLYERFNGLTSPLYLYLTVLISFFSKNIINAVNLACGVLFIGSVVFLQIIFATSAGRLAGMLATVLVVVSPFFYSCFGMETSLFMLLILLSIYLFQRESFLALSVVLGFLSITRNEGVFLILVMGIEVFRKQGVKWFWRNRILLLPIVLPTVLVAFWNYFYYDKSLPHTAIVKFWQGVSGYWGRWPFAFIDIRYQINWFWGDNPWLCIISVSLFLFGLWRLRLSSLNRIVFPFLMLYAGTFTLLNIPNYHWYYAVFYLFGLAYAGVGLAFLLQWTFLLRRLFHRLLAVAIVVTLSAVLFLAFGQISWNRTQITGPQPQYFAVANWLAEHTEPTKSVAAVEIGTIGWYCDHPVIDILGLITPDNACSIGHRDIFSWLNRSFPDYVIVHDPLWIFEEAMRGAEQRGEYIQVPDITPPGLRLLRRCIP